jgi:hypothetical protein
MFIATNVGTPEGGSHTSLSRHDFLEMLVRLANLKKEKGVT